MPHRWLILLALIVCATYALTYKTQDTFNNNPDFHHSTDDSDAIRLRNPHATYNGGDQAFTSAYYEGIQGRPYGINNV